MTSRAGRAVARSASPPSRRTGSNVRTPCRSTTTSAKRVGRSRRCGPWHSSGTHAPARNAGPRHREHSSAHQPLPVATRVAALSTPHPSRARPTRTGLWLRIQPAAAVACAACHCRAPCPRADECSRRTGRSDVAGSNQGRTVHAKRHRGCATGRIKAAQPPFFGRLGRWADARSWLNFHRARRHRHRGRARNRKNGTMAACCIEVSAAIGRGRRSAAPMVSRCRTRPMPRKANAARRHHIPRPKRRLINSSEYDAALRRRGSLTVWFTEEAITAWKAAPRTTPGGQPCYSDLAITTALMLRTVLRLALRQTDGLIGSILQLLGLDLPVPEPARASAATTPRSAGAHGPSPCRRHRPAAVRSVCWWIAPA